MKADFSKRKIIIILTLAFLLLIGLVVYSTGLFRREEPKSHTKDVVTLNWYIDQPWFVETWGADQVSKKITEETGVFIHFIVLVRTDGVAHVADDHRKLEGLPVCLDEKVTARL